MLIKHALKYLSASFTMICLPIIPNQVHNYLDPGTGSLIIQFLVGTLIGGLVVVKIYWQRINLYIKKVFSRTKSDEKISE